MKPILIALCLLFSSPVLAEDSTPWWKIWKSADEAVGVSDRLFTETERRILNEYLRTQGIEDDDDGDKKKKHKKGKHKKSKKQKSLPPGLQKKVARGGQLPPGWQKKVARGEVLDAELYEVSEDLPKGILRQLPESPEGTSIRKIEDRVVRILDATGVILDVLTGK
ncbi:MAG: hypothetical protein OQL16_00600 [Gammaproteobacteria bacterium]|nr:hypothetical protein [Gammaproteobacteria bacterium]